MDKLQNERSNFYSVEDQDQLLHLDERIAILEEWKMILSKPHLLNAYVEGYL